MIVIFVIGITALYFTMLAIIISTIKELALPYRDNICLFSMVMCIIGITCGYIAGIAVAVSSLNS